jgi:hypothetical protein
VRDGRVVHRRRAPERLSTGRFPELSYNRFPQAIQLPPLSSPKDGPPYRLLQRQALSQKYGMRPSGGGYRQLVTLEAATSLGLPPSVLG